MKTALPSSYSSLITYDGPKLPLPQSVLDWEALGAGKDEKPLKVCTNSVLRKFAIIQLHYVVP